jgi:hypothetical protein
MIYDEDCYAVCCRKFEVDAVSQDGISVAEIDIGFGFAIPIYFDAHEGLNEEELCNRLAVLLGLTGEEMIDFRSCNLSGNEALERISERWIADHTN